MTSSGFVHATPCGAFSFTRGSSMLRGAQGPRSCAGRFGGVGRGRVIRMVQVQPAGTDTTCKVSRSFAEFFRAMPGSWNSQRTYHYVGDAGQTREESQTTFDVGRLSEEEVDRVLRANNKEMGKGGVYEGFAVSFLTKMGSREELVRAGTNVGFVGEEVDGENGVIKGGYYRDVGYEESGAVVGQFEYESGTRELRMVTKYSRIISVDEIRLVAGDLRLRRIVNYENVNGERGRVRLVGYGVEIRGEGERLVK